MATMNRKLEGKDLEDFQVKELVEAIQRRLARIEAEVLAAANRYTVVFELGPRNLGGGPVCWRARVLEAPLTAAGETLEETAGFIARQLTAHRRRIETK